VKLDIEFGIEIGNKKPPIITEVEQAQVCLECIISEHVQESLTVIEYRCKHKQDRENNGNER
jgi:hypothetical protein